MAKVDVINAVFGNTNENQPIVKTIRPGPMADTCAKLAMKKKKIASLIMFARGAKRSKQ